MFRSQMVRVGLGQAMGSATPEIRRLATLSNSSTNNVSKLTIFTPMLALTGSADAGSSGSSTQLFMAAPGRPEEAKGHPGMLVFAGILGAVAGNVLVARRYGKRVMSFRVPEEAANRYSSHVERDHFAKYWEPEARRARWEAYFKRAEEEEKRRMQRLYEWVMHEREKDHLREKLHRFYQQRPDPYGWEQYQQAFHGRQRQQQQKRKSGGKAWSSWRAKNGWYKTNRGDSNFYGRWGESEVDDEDVAFVSKLRRSKRALGLQEDQPVTEEEVKRAFRRQALKYHPDRSAGADERVSRQNTNRFKEANEAYSFLLQEVSTSTASARGSAHA